MELLERLINAHGVSGNEGQIREVIRKEITPLVDEVWTDSSGNLVAHEKGRPPRIMLSAHMDEIGLMVREITTNGLLLCAAVGGVNPLAMIGTRVTVEGAKEDVHGLITTREISCGYDVEELPGIDDLAVDTGLSREELIRRGVTVGSFLEPNKQTNWLVHGDMISGKALDDRVGCYVLIEVARQLRKSKQDVFFAFTVQEEIGLYGAKTSAFAIRPRWAIVVDVTPALDLAEDADKSTVISVGSGPCLLHMDESFIADAGLNRVILDVADKLGIKLQHEVSSFGTTDATNISTVRRGVPAATVSVPVRNVHSTLEIANRHDVAGAIKLLVELLRKPPAELRRARSGRGSRSTARLTPKQVKAQPKKKKKAAGKKPKKAAPKKRAAPKKKAKPKKKAVKKAKRKPKPKRAARKKPKRRLKSSRSPSGRPRSKARPKARRKRKAMSSRGKRR